MARSAAIRFGVAALLCVMSSGAAMGAEGDPVPGAAPAPTLGAAGVPPAPVGPAAAGPALLGLPTAPADFPSVSPTTPATGAPGTGTGAGLQPLLPTLRTIDADSTAGLPSLAAVSGETTGGAEATTPTAAVISGGLTTNYAFLFRDTDEDNVVRDKYTQEEAERIAAKEVTRLSEGFQSNQQGSRPIEGGAWDFYFQQMELYDRYVRETVLKGSDELDQLPDQTYDAQNYLQERNDQKSAFEQEAVRLGNEQYNENLDFYDRLQTREDRRRAYYEWLAEQKRIVDEIAVRWAREVNGSNWGATDRPTRLDDWYYKTNFAAEGGVNVAMDGYEYVLSRDPLKRVPNDTVNVLSTNLTPYDIVDPTGRLKTPAEERMKMGLKASPAEAAAGTIEITP